ncbi:protein takeout-like [Artemia franciscana]|uniref:Hemolymph juvenile hormone binding protein n=1 Tax=Artemia franciscana TaxID=6661 RepID=A0AA88H9K5_ARTSF|nr:hypothetical protein QYM36_016986 [Artemia franciscana]
MFSVRWCLLFLGTIGFSFAARFADQVRKCNLDNRASLNACFTRQMEDLRPFMTTGIPELNVPVLDPMVIPVINFRQPTGPVSINAKFNQVQVKGMAKFTDAQVRVDPDRMRMDVFLRIPELRSTGNYEINGNVFVLPVSGTGSSWSILNGVTATGGSDLEIVGRRPNEFLRAKNTQINFKIDKTRIRLNNLFNGDQILGDTVNNFLNDNSEDVLDEVRPEISKILNDFVQKVLNDGLSSLPVDKFLTSSRRRA